MPSHTKRTPTRLTWIESLCGAVCDNGYRSSRVSNQIEVTLIAFACLSATLRNACETPPSLSLTRAAISHQTQPAVVATAHHSTQTGRRLPPLCFEAVICAMAKILHQNGRALSSSALFGGKNVFSTPKTPPWCVWTSACVTWNLLFSESLPFKRNDIQYAIWQHEGTLWTTL